MKEIDFWFSWILLWVSIDSIIHLIFDFPSGFSIGAILVVWYYRRKEWIKYIEKKL